MNIFTLAPKELTNSAIWAWILQSLASEQYSDDPRRKIAEKMFSIMGISLPAPSEIHEIITEKSLRTMHRPAGMLGSGNERGRIDVFFRTMGNQPFVFFIENKVAELNKDVTALLEQMERYYSYLDVISKTDNSYCTLIYPAYFGYETDTAEALTELAKSRNSILNGRLITFPVPKMLAAFEGSGFEKNPILNDFHRWLKSREKFIGFRAAARRGVNVSIAEVIEASRPLGFGHLLAAFVSGMERCSRVNSQISKRSVDVRNINFFKGAATPITLRWYYNSSPNGLYIGFHKQFDKILNVNFSHRSLPPAFAFEADSEWLFGFLKTEEEISTFWSAIS